MSDTAPGRRRAPALCRRARGGLAAVSAVLALLTLGTPPASAETPARRLPADAVQAFWAGLVPASPDTRAALEEWRTVLPPPAMKGDLRAASFESVRQLLDTAVEGGLSAVEIFADPAWHAAERLVLIPETVLKEVDRHFRLRTLLEPVALDLDGRAVRMQWLLLGAGWLLIAYDRAAEIRHPDYAVATGRYGYRRFLRLRAGLDGAGRPALSDVEGGDTPGSIVPGLPGPLGSALRSFAVAGDRIVCGFTWAGVASEREVPRRPIERRAPGVSGGEGGRP